MASGALAIFHASGFWLERGSPSNSGTEGGHPLGGSLSPRRRRPGREGSIGTPGDHAMSFLTVGVVSNVWARLLPESGLEALCAAAGERGFGYVELRQGALGECEAAAASGGTVPLPERLGRLAATFPGLGFNLAVALPLFGGAAIDEALVSASIASARALGG